MTQEERIQQLENQVDELNKKIERLETITASLQNAVSQSELNFSHLSAQISANNY